VSDRTVLAGRVHSLEHHEERPAVLGVETLLELLQALEVRTPHVRGSRLVEARRAGRVLIRQAEAFAGYPEPLFEVKRLRHRSHSRRAPVAASHSQG
jgi:hypothetical protein